MTITPVSVDSAGNLGNSGSYNPSISADGRFVAFSSGASNIVPGDTNNTHDIFVRDTLTNTTTRVSVDSAGNQANSNSDGPSISADGRFVAFDSDASNLVPGDTNNSYDIFVRDTLTNTTTRVSVDSAGNQGNSDSDRPSISADGRFVAFLLMPPTSCRGILTIETTSSCGTRSPIPPPASL
jgi:Tol biopolymer transport system component